MTQKRFKNILKMFRQQLQKFFKKCFIHVILYGSTYIIKT